jgi:hypothetical protein
MSDIGRLPDKGTTRRIISDFFLAHRELIVPPVLEVGSARPANAWWADLRAQLGGISRDEWTGVDMQESDCTDIVWDVTAPDSFWPGEIMRLVAECGSCVCAEVLEHVKYPAKFLENVFMFLRPGAWIVITTPFAFPVHESTGPDYWRFTPSGIQLTLENAGFVDIRTRDLQVTRVTFFDHIFGFGYDKDWDLPLWIGAIARKPE